MLQRTKFKITLYAVIFINLTVLLGFWLYWSSAQARDYERLGDLKVWQNILGYYYSQNGTYIIPNCAAGETLSSCLAQKVGKITINNINDPLNSGNYRYTVGSLGESDYEIQFALETGIAGLSRGGYILTKNGIRK
jgi:hypothetical protein